MQVQVFVGLQVSNSSFSWFHIRDKFHLARSSGSSSFQIMTNRSEWHIKQRFSWIQSGIYCYYACFIRVMWNLGWRTACRSDFHCFGQPYCETQIEHKIIMFAIQINGKKVVNLAIDILHNGDVWMASLWVSSHFVNSHFVNSQFVNSHLVNVDQVGNWQSGIDEVGVDKLGICGYLPLCQFKGTVVVVGRVSSSGEWPTYLDLFWRSQIQYCGVSPPVWLPTSLHPHSTFHTPPLYYTFHPQYVLHCDTKGIHFCQAYPQAMTNNIHTMLLS